jgi:hypothetical protein
MPTITVIVKIRDLPGDLHMHTQSEMYVFNDNRAADFLKTTAPLEQCEEMFRQLSEKCNEIEPVPELDEWECDFGCYYP